MKLNLPILEHISNCRSLLIAGMGGGFDVYCGLPIYFALKAQGMNVHLANYSFTDTTLLDKGTRLTEWLVGVNAGEADDLIYGPELHFARWFHEKGEDPTIWMFHKTGVRPLIEGYQALVEYLQIDGILLVDGGVDSLLRGDEAEIGTILEDLVSLVAVKEISSVKTKLIAATALGAEQDMCYAHVFENIAALTKVGAFYGACALTPDMQEYQDYQAAVLYAQSQPYQDPSVINSSVVSAARGEYGNYHLTAKTAGSRLWISPLMALYWFFDLHPVAARSLLYTSVRYTDTFQDVWRAATRVLGTMGRRKHTRVGLT